jgi:hypothetical protein
VLFENIFAIERSSVCLFVNQKVMSHPKITICIYLYVRMYTRYINYKKCLSHCIPRQNQLFKCKWHRGTEDSHITSIALDRVLSCVLRHLPFVIFLGKESLPPAFCTTLFCCFVRVFFFQSGCFQKLWSSNYKTNIQKKKLPTLFK